MNWLTPKCPVNFEDKAWLEDCFLWLIEEFGSDTLRKTIVVLPTDEFFPDRFSSDRGDLRTLVNRVCGYMNVDSEQVKLQFFTDEETLLRRDLPAFESSHSHALGLYYKRRGKYIISLETSQATNPTNLIATIAHELGHVRLLGEDRLDPDYEDHELLTDLTAVFFGMGIFIANSVFSFQQWTNAFSQGWQAERKGYMTEEMLGYALALFAYLRHENKPIWAKYLEGSVKTYFKNSLKYLEKTGDAKLHRLE
jgi:hypothetical protein